MKTKIIFTLLALLSVTTAPGQSKVGKEMDKFFKKYEAHCKPTLYTSPRGNSFSRVYEFNLGGESAQKAVRKLNMKFKRCAGDAYSYREHDAKGATAGGRLDIVYGDRLELKSQFFAFPNRHYTVMQVSDTREPRCRYVYALAWWTEGTVLKVVLQQVYSGDPRYTKETPSAPTATYTLAAPKEKADVITTSTQFIQRFGNIREALHSGTNNALTLSLSNKMLELCKNHSNLLDNVERQICHKALTALSRQQSDTFVRNILNYAAEFLKQ